MVFSKRLPALAAALVMFLFVAAACGGNGNGGNGNGGNGNGGSAGGGPAGDAAAGRTVFLEAAEPSCGDCHVLADAGTTGTIGPNLDELAPSAEVVRRAVEEGPGAMPSFADQLSEQQMNDVAAYVAEAAGGE